MCIYEVPVLSNPPLSLDFQPPTSSDAGGWLQDTSNGNGCRPASEKRSRVSVGDKDKPSCNIRSLCMGVEADFLTGFSAIDMSQIFTFFTQW